METFMAWLVFLGAWLLFAGPIYQAVLELRDEDIEIDRIRAAKASVQKPENVSAWWWILPPLKIYKEFASRRAYQWRYVKTLTREDLESVVSFQSKAFAWSLVAVGGFFVACDETYNVVQQEGWSNLVLLLMIIGMLVLSILNLILQTSRAKAVTKL